MTPLVWALWIFAGGGVNSGYLTQPAPVAYFHDLEECQRVANVIVTQSAYYPWSDEKRVEYRLQNRVKCVQARYIK